jgi:thymidylate synthase
MATIIEATSIASLWCKTYGTIKRDGVKVSGIQEISNLIMVLRGNFGTNKTFDKHFRSIFGDERIDYASSVTFVQPKKTMIGWSYQQNEPMTKWTNTYWGRMINFSGQVNQIEAAIKKLAGGKNTKMISIAVYDPVSDSKKVMGGVPCLSSLDIKPRNKELHITAFFRSMRFSKAGYADIKALCDLGLYLCSRTDMTMGSLTLHATSGHNFYSGEEAVNGNKLLTVMTELSRKGKQ